MPPPRKAPFLDLRGLVDELFEQLVHRPWAIPAARAWCPVADIHETPEAYEVVIDLPGVAPQDVVLLAGERSLTIAGQRQDRPPSGAVVARRERPGGEFRRTIAFPHPIDPEKVTAEYQHGTYHIHLPRRADLEGTATPGNLARERQELRVTMRSVYAAVKCDE